MRSLRLKLSPEGKELAELKHRERSRQITNQHYAKIQQLRGGVRSGATVKAIENEIFAMALESAESWVEAYIQEYIREDLIPDEAELSDIGFKIEEIVRHFSHNEQLPIRAGASESFRILPMQIYQRLRERVRIMILESKRPKPAQPAAGGTHYTTNIGTNYGGVQSGGEGNTQTIKDGDDEAK